MIIKTIKKYIKKFPYILSGLYKLVIIKNQTYKFIKLIGKDNEKILLIFISKINGEIMNHYLVMVQQLGHYRNKKNN